MLARKVAGMLYERTALSKKPEEIIRQELAVLRERGDLSPTLVFQDPYMLDFLQLADAYSRGARPEAGARAVISLPSHELPILRRVPISIPRNANATQSIRPPPP